MGIEATTAGGEAGPTGNTYDKYGTSNPIARRLMRGFFDALDRSLPARADRVLEVGVGEGEVLGHVRDRLHPSVAVGLDLPHGDLREHWAQRTFHALEADGERLPFGDGTFDLVVCVEVLEHVARPGQVLAEIGRVGSRHVVMSVPREPIWRVANMARGQYLRDLGNTPGHVNHWSSRAFRSLVAGHVDVESVRHPFPWTMIGATVRS